MNASMTYLRDVKNINKVTDECNTSTKNEITEAEIHVIVPYFLHTPNFMV